MDHEIGAYYALQILVPKLSDKGFVLHYARYSRKNGFQGSKRSTYVWFWRHPASNTVRMGILNRHIPVRLDELFKLTSKGIVYGLAYITIFNSVRGTRLKGMNKILGIKFITRRVGIIIPITKIEKLLI